MLMYYVNQMSLLIFKLVFWTSRYLIAYQNWKIINLNSWIGLKNIFTLRLKHVFMSFIGSNKTCSNLLIIQNNWITDLQCLKNKIKRLWLLSNYNLFLSKINQQAEIQENLSMLSLPLFERFLKGKIYQLISLIIEVH